MEEEGAPPAESEPTPAAELANTETENGAEAEAGGRVCYDRKRWFPQSQHV